MTTLKPGDWARIKHTYFGHEMILEGLIWTSDPSRLLRIGSVGIAAPDGDLQQNCTLLDHRPAPEPWREARYVETDQHQYAKHPDGRDTWFRINPDLDLRRLWLKTDDLISECASGVPRIIVDRDGHIVGDR